jgi:hypothetical protein
MGLIVSPTYAMWDSPMGYARLSWRCSETYFPGNRLRWPRNDHLGRWSRNETIFKPVTPHHVAAVSGIIEVSICVRNYRHRVSLQETAAS